MDEMGGQGEVTGQGDLFVDGMLTTLWLSLRVEI